MNTPLTPEQKAARFGFWVKISIFILFGLIVAPIIAMAIYGLAGVIVAALVGVTAITFAPVVAMKLANWKLKALKAEARKNPVETLQTELKRRQQLLDEKRKSIELFIGKVNTFEGKLAQFAKDYPQEVPRFQHTLEQMQKLSQLRKNNYRKAKLETEAFEKEIEKAGAIWEMGQVAASTAEGSGMSEEDFYAKIKTRTSLDAIQDSMNSAFAQLDVSLLDQEDNQVKQLASPNTAQLLDDAEQEAQPVPFRQTVNVEK